MTSTKKKVWNDKIVMKVIFQMWQESVLVVKAGGQYQLKALTSPKWDQLE